MSPKIGRPTDNPKSERVTVRLDSECSKIISEYCKIKRVNKGEAIRDGIRKLDSKKENGNPKPTK